MNPDPVKGYAQMAVLIVIAVVVMALGAGLFMGGVYVGKGQSARTVIAKNEALSNASASLRASAAALRSVNTEAQRRIALAASEKREAEKAMLAATAAQHQAEAKKEAIAQELADARRRPKCAALLDMDLRKECGL
jgi:uncharacterized sporulation protein YeaH/YhbH (DUF444 family)